MFTTGPENYRTDDTKYLSVSDTAVLHWRAPYSWPIHVNDFPLELKHYAADHFYPQTPPLKKEYKGQPPITQQVPLKQPFKIGYTRKGRQ